MYNQMVTWTAFAILAMFYLSLISQDCQSGSIDQSSPGGPGIKLVSFHDMYSEKKGFLSLFVLYFSQVSKVVSS